jgi:hypothetical protein
MLFNNIDVDVINSSVNIITFKTGKIKKFTTSYANINNLHISNFNTIDSILEDE